MRKFHDDNVCVTVLRFDNQEYEKDIFLLGICI